MSWLLENITMLLTEMIGGAIDYFGEFLNSIYVWIVEFAMMNVYYINAKKFIVSTALLLIGVMVLKVVISGYLLETDYDPDADPFNLLVKVVQTVAVIMNSGWLFDWLFKAGKDFTSDLIGAANAEGYCGKTRELLDIRVGAIATGMPWHIIMMFIILISVIIFTVVAGIRAGELVAMNLLFPYFALDLLTNSRERWKNFFSAYLIAFFSYAFQLLFYMVAMKSYMSATTGHPLYSITTIVFMVMAIRAPRFMEKFIYASGVSNAASGGIRMLAQTSMMRWGIGR